jgi:hypothetical protein
VTPVHPFYVYVSVSFLFYAEAHNRGEYFPVSQDSHLQRISLSIATPHPNYPALSSFRPTIPSRNTLSLSTITNISSK